MHPMVALCALHGMTLRRFESATSDAAFRIQLNEFKGASQLQYLDNGMWDIMEVGYFSAYSPANWSALPVRLADKLTPELINELAEKR